MASIATRLVTVISTPLATPETVFVQIGSARLAGVDLLVKVSVN